LGEFGELDLDEPSAFMECHTPQKKSEAINTKHITEIFHRETLRDKKKGCTVGKIHVVPWFQLDKGLQIE
jgi:hypothetical protein